MSAPTNNKRALESSSSSATPNNPDSQKKKPRLDTTETAPADAELPPPLPATENTTLPAPQAVQSAGDDAREAGPQGPTDAADSPLVPLTAHEEGGAHTPNTSTTEALVEEGDGPGDAGYDADSEDISDDSSDDSSDE